MKTLVERAQKWGQGYDPECVTEAGQLIDECITALREMEGRIDELEDNEQALNGLMQAKDRRIEELEKWNAEMVEKAASGGVLEGYREMGAKIERLDAALAKCKNWLTTDVQNGFKLSQIGQIIDKARAGG